MRVEDRCSIVASQLPVQTWPERSLAMVEVNVETGERRAFDRHSGVELVDVLVATTAFWGAPPVFFEGHHYIDGGFYSSDNADLAIGSSQSVPWPPGRRRIQPCVHRSRRQDEHKAGAWPRKYAASEMALDARVFS
ncbi:MAG TPA: patatin-like phospholipase family protein [Bryobacteraceae bacterium]|nr:patatin-like phospholipase family protein [Bryobacteraceae bacterium]